MREWRIERQRSLFRHQILELQRRQLTAGTDRREVLVLHAPEWVNVIPLLDDDRVVLVRQWRYGIQAPTLEIPGGMVGPGEDARTAAVRELVEETGYSAGALRRLGSTHPNPAFIDSCLTTWLATDLTAVEEGKTSFGVDGEEIQCDTVALDEIPRLIASGRISHALVVAAFYLLDQDQRLGSTESSDQAEPNKGA
jgi:ADP-ribose pyrophosphatase